MGTNYYLQEIVECDLGHEHIKRTHIGKASVGWKFCFQCTDKYHTYSDWSSILSNSHDKWSLIYDEYDNIVEWKTLKEVIKSKRDGRFGCISQNNYMDGAYWFSKADFS
jgi:hypothetical protein